MKSILNPTGGRPIKNEDIELFEQFITIFESIFENIPSLTDFIVSGCQISGSDVSAGYIYYDGKICTFEGASGVSFPLAMERTSVDGTPRTFFDGIVKNTIHTESIAAQVGGGFSLSTSTPRLEDFFVKAATNAETITGTDTDKAVTPASLSARTATTDRSGLVEKATSSERDSGVADKYIDAALLAGYNSGLRQNVVYIGNWNMDATVTVNVAHGLTDLSKIRDVSAVIVDDSASAWYLLNSSPLGTSSLAGYIAGVDSTNVVLGRVTGGFFDSSSFDSLSGNRGFVLITYSTL